MDDWSWELNFYAQVDNISAMIKTCEQSGLHFLTDDELGASNLIWTSLGNHGFNSNNNECLETKQELIKKK